jgi:hypothetical protein
MVLTFTITAVGKCTVEPSILHRRKWLRMKTRIRDYASRYTWGHGVHGGWRFSSILPLGAMSVSPKRLLLITTDILTWVTKRLEGATGKWIGEERSRHIWKWWICGTSFGGSSNVSGQTTAANCMEHSLLRSYQFFSQSTNSPHFTEPKYSLPCSQKPATFLCRGPD